MKVVSIENILKNKKLVESNRNNVQERIDSFIAKAEKLYQETPNINIEIIQEFLLEELGEENTIVIYGLYSEDKPFLIHSRISEIAFMLSDKLSPNYFVISKKDVTEDGYDYFTNITFFVTDDGDINVSSIRVIGAGPAAGE